MTQEELYEIQKKYRRRKVSFAVDMTNVSGAAVSPAMKASYRYMMVGIFSLGIGIFVGSVWLLVKAHWLWGISLMLLAFALNQLDRKISAFLVVKYALDDYQFLRAAISEKLITIKALENQKESIQDKKDAGNIEELYLRAVEITKKAGYASTALLQRRLRVRFVVALDLMEMMTDRGIVGAYDGTNTRKLRGR
jgi:DNA segregation ATPase FtsK/SpoIIIE-like protein